MFEWILSPKFVSTAVLNFCHLIGLRKPIGLAQNFAQTGAELKECAESADLLLTKKKYRLLKGFGQRSINGGQKSAGYGLELPMGMAMGISAEREETLPSRLTDSATNCTTARFNRECVRAIAVTTRRVSIPRIFLRELVPRTMPTRKEKAEEAINAAKRILKQSLVLKRPQRFANCGRAV